MQREFYCAVIAGFMVCLWTSCDSDVGDSTENDTASEVARGDTELVLDESHNYSFSSNVDIKEYPLRGYPEVPVIDWSGLSKDILGHEIEPEEDVGHVEIVVWKLEDNDTFEEWLNADALDMSALVAPVNVSDEDMANKVTRISLDELVSFGFNGLDPEEYFQTGGEFPSDEHLFVLVIGRGDVLGRDAIVAAFLKPVDDPEAPTEVMIDESAISMTFTAVLNENGYTVPSDTGKIIVDWRSIMGQKNALGQEFVPDNAERMMLTFYKDKTLTELQERFIDLQIMADATYQTDPADMSPLLLEELKNEDGEPFNGLGEEEGTWLLTLWCTSCNNPAPKYMTMLQPARR